MAVKPAQVQIYWKRRTESLESLRFGLTLKEPSVDEDSGISGIQNLGKLPPIPFTNSETVDIFYQSVSLSGKKRKIEWLDTRHNTTINQTGGIDSDDTTVTLTAALGISIGDVLKIENEYVTVTDVNGNDIDISRAQHGTTAAAHTNSTKVLKMVCSVPFNSQVLDGRVDLLPQVADFDAAGGKGLIKLTWSTSTFTAVERKLLKHFNIYRNTTGTFSGEGILVAQADTTFYVDPLSENDTTLYYYWVRPIDTTGNLGNLSGSQSARQTTDTAIPNTPTCVVVAELQPNGQLLLTFGIDPPGGNDAGVTKTQVQIADNMSFSPVAYDQTFSVMPVSGSWLSPYRRIYFVRARIYNAFGWSDWSATVTVNEASVITEPETSWPGAVQNLTFKSDDVDANIPGLELVVTWDTPASNVNTLYDYAVQIYTSATFPSHTFHKGPSTAVFNAGEYTLTHSGQDFTGLSGKILFVYRNGNDHNHLVGSSKIVSVAGNTLTIADRFRYSSDDYSGNMYYAVVTPDWELVTIATDVPVPIEGNTFKPKKSYRAVISGLAAGTYYARVCAGNKIGLSDWVVSSGVTLDGIKTADLKNAAVTYPKISVDEVDDITQDFGTTINAGTVTAVTFKTAASGSRIQIDGNGIYCYEGAADAFHVSLTSFQVYAADLRPDDVTVSGIFTINSSGALDCNVSVAEFISVDITGSYKMDGSDVIDSTKKFVGSGVAVSGDVSSDNDMYCTGDLGCDGTLRVGSTTLTGTQLAAIKSHVGV